jgi:hypothetical protein
MKDLNLKLSGIIITAAFTVIFLFCAALKSNTTEVAFAFTLFAAGAAFMCWTIANDLVKAVNGQLDHYRTKVIPAMQEALRKNEKDNRYGCLVD